MSSKKKIGSVSFTEPTTLTSFATSLIAFATARGMKIGEIADITDISLINFVDPNSRVPDCTIAELTHSIDRRWPNVPVSMEIARFAPLSMLGGLAQGSQFAPNVESLLDWWVRSSWIVADQSKVYVEKSSSEVALVLAHPGESTGNGIAMEAGIGIHWRLLNSVTHQEMPLIRTEFADEKSAPVTPYEAFFKTPVEFQRGRNALVFSKEALTVPIRLANSEMFELIDHQFASLRQKCIDNSYPAPLSKLRQSIIEHADRGEYTATAVAESINLSLRSAQRLAAQYDTSLQYLIDEVRLENSKNFLNNTEFTIEKISQLVGYNDARSFRRAFKRWTGLTPKIYRSSS